MNENAIQVEHVSKMYKLYNRLSDRLREALGMRVQVREHYALKDVDFSVKRGETVGIIGTNGSGKSTVLKIITGVVSPTSGQVKVDGRISALLELGAGFNMEYTGIENVYLNGTMIGFSKEEIDSRLDEILSFADIGDFVYQPVKSYSLSVGDVFFQAKCYHKFEEFKKQGKTIVIVSHDLNNISQYCDRVILLNKGTLIEEGEPKRIVDLYKQILVNQEEKKEQKVLIRKQENCVYGTPFDRPFDRNPATLEYGNGEAEIVDFTIEDARGLASNTIHKMEDFTVKMKVHFHEDISEVIYAFSFKDIRGTEITGTNTMFERIPVEPQKKGNTQTITFTQKMNLQGGEYLLSLGCTGYKSGEFVVFHRLYDVCSLTVVAEKNSVGYYDMDSRITVE